MKHNIDDAQLQAAIDEACQEVAKGPHRPICAELSLRADENQMEAPARLALAKEFLDRLPEPTPLIEFQREVSTWAAATFPHQTAASKVAHLTDEVKELADNPADGEEMADCFILLLNLADMGGFDLLEEARKKMAKNKLRKWGAPDERGVSHHIKPEPTPPVVDGKTPGQVAHAGYLLAGNYGSEEKWASSASAVLAAFGGASLEAAIARMEAVPCEELLDILGEARGDGLFSLNAVRARLIDAARGHGEAVGQSAEIPWIEWNGGECPLKDEEVEEWEYKMRDGEVMLNSAQARPSYREWKHEKTNPDFADITAYRVLKWRKGCEPNAVDWKAKYEALETEHGIASRAVNNILRILPELTKSPSWEDSAVIIRQHIDNIQARVEKLEAELARIVAAAHEAGWNGVENSKDLAQFIKDQNETLEKWSKHIHPEAHDRIVKGVQDRAKIAIQEAREESLSRLRPLAEAGPVPEGAVRVSGYWSNKREEWLLSVTNMEADTHFADILLPESLPIATLAQDQVEATPAMQAAADAVLREEMEANQPADPYAELKAAHAEGKIIQWRFKGATAWMTKTSNFDQYPDKCEYRIKPEPSTFEAHGHTWTMASHRPQNATAPVYWLLESELSGARDYAPDFISTSENLGDWEGIVGWRYADEPTPAPDPDPVPPWQPAVGDVVTLKSGSPKMTICQIQGTVCKCQWFRGNEADMECFETATLQPA